MIDNLERRQRTKPKTQDQTQEKVSGYDKEIPQSHNEDGPIHGTVRMRHITPTAIKRTNAIKVKQCSSPFFFSEMIAKLYSIERTLILNNKTRTKRKSQYKQLEQQYRMDQQFEHQQTLNQQQQNPRLKTDNSRGYSTAGGCLYKSSP